MEGKPASQGSWRTATISRTPPGKGRDFHGAQHGLASGAGSDGRVIGATLVGLLRVLAHGHRAPCPLVLEARVVCAVSTGGSMGLAGRATARRSGARAERSIHRFFERSELMLSLAAKLGEGERRAG
jgi:hypothetical protein